MLIDAQKRVLVTCADVPLSPIIKKHVAGIYRITVAHPSGQPKFYIGQASCLRSRMQIHISTLHRGKHHAIALQSAYNKHGISSFFVEILEECDAVAETLTALEQKHFDATVMEFGKRSVYNSRHECVASNLGVPMSVASRLNLSQKAKGRKPHANTIEAVRLAKTGKKISSESIAKRTAKQKGLKRTPEMNAARSAAMIGRKLSPEHCASISTSKKGWRPSAEHIERIRAASTGRKQTPEAIAKIVMALTGRKKDPSEISRRQATRIANAAAKLARSG